MIDLNKIDWKAIIISAIENPNLNTKDFDELREKTLKENHYFSKNKVIYENNKVKFMVSIGWDKSKFFFLYESVVIDKQTNKRVLGVDEAHGYRHLHSDKFTSPNPETILSKIEHPILSLIIKSETNDRKKKWIERLANELKISQQIWRKFLENKKILQRIT